MDSRKCPADHNPPITARKNFETIQYRPHDQTTGLLRRTSQSCPNKVHKSEIQIAKIARPTKKVSLTLATSTQTHTLSRQTSLPPEIPEEEPTAPLSDSETKSKT